MGEALPSGRRTHFGFRPHFMEEEEEKIVPLSSPQEKNLLNVNDERAERERETFFFFFLGTRPTSSLLQVDVYREITHTHTHTLLFYYDCTTTTSRYSPRGGRKTGPCVCCVCVRKRRKVGLDARRRKQKPPGVAQRKKKNKKQVQVLFSVHFWFVRDGQSYNPDNLCIIRQLKSRVVLF